MLSRHRGSLSCTVSDEGYLKGAACMALSSNEVLRIEGRHMGRREMRRWIALCISLVFCIKIVIQWVENITYIYAPKW